MGDKWSSIKKVQFSNTRWTQGHWWMITFNIYVVVIMQYLEWLKSDHQQIKIQDGSTWPWKVGHDLIYNSIEDLIEVQQLIQVERYCHLLRSPSEQNIHTKGLQCDIYEKIKARYKWFLSSYCWSSSGYIFWKNFVNGWRVIHQKLKSKIAINDLQMYVKVIDEKCH